MVKNLGLIGNTSLNKMFGIYCVDVYGLNTLAQEMLSSSFTQILGETPSEWTLDIKAYPFILSRTGISETQKLKIGNFKSNAFVGTVVYDTYLISSNFYYGEYGNPYKHYYDVGKYVNIDIYLPFLGYVQLDSNLLYKKFTHVFLSVDFITGMGTYTICVSDDVWQQSGTAQPIPENYYDLSGLTIINQYTVNLAVDIPITRTNNADTKRNLLYNITGSVAQLAAGIALKNPYIIASGVGSAVATVTKDYSESNVTRTETKNVGGTNFSGFGYNKVYFRITKIEPLIYEGTEDYKNYLHQNGSPLVRYVSDLTDFIDSGYTELSSFHLDEPGFNRATEQELDELQTLLSQGIIL